MTHTYPMPPGRGGTSRPRGDERQGRADTRRRRGSGLAISNVAKAVNARSITAVPMLKNNRVVGVINVARSRPGLFAARQIALLQDLRRPGGDRHRERPAVRRGAGAHRAISARRWSSRRRQRTCSRRSAVRRSILQTVLDTLVESAVGSARADMGGITVARRRYAMRVHGGSGRFPGSVVRTGSPHFRRPRHFQRTRCHGRRRPSMCPTCWRIAEYARPEAADHGRLPG